MGTISSSDNIQLDVLLVSGSSKIFLTQPTTTQLVGNDFSIDIFAQSGLLAALDQESVLVPLGTLSPGTYNYEVNLSTVLIEQLPIEGSFTVVPEPACTLGDVDLSGGVDFSDVAPFIAVLSGGPFQCEADCDENGVVDFSDIAPFIAILSGP